MPNLKSPGKKLGKKPAAAEAPTQAQQVARASRRLSNVAMQAAQAAQNFCVVVERMKARGIAMADIEVELGLDAGDLKTTFEFFQSAVEATSDLSVPTWTE